MSARPIPAADLEAIFRPSPAASLRASAAAFEAIGRTFDAEFSRQLAEGAAIDPSLYHDWARQQAERVVKLYSMENVK